MGNFQANQSNEIAASYLSMVTNIIASAATKLKSQNELINNININHCGPPCAGVCIADEIFITQNNVLQQTITAEDLSNVVASVKSQLTAATTQWAQQQSTSNQGWLSTAFSVQINDTNAVSKVAESITNNISDDTTTACAGFNFDENNANLLLCGTVTKAIIISQSNAVTNIVSCITQQTLKAFVAGSEYATTIQTADQIAYSKQEGLFGWIETVAIVIAVVIVLFLIVHLLLHVSGHYKPKPAPTQQEDGGQQQGQGFGALAQQQQQQRRTQHPQQRSYRRNTPRVSPMNVARLERGASEFEGIAEEAA